MELGELISGTDFTCRGTLALPISGIARDSRVVREGSLFVAIEGSLADGHRYVDDAVSRGAVAVLVSKPVPVPDQVTQVLVPDTRAALAIAAALFFREPSRALKLVGVTGTNGKTTTSYLIEAMFEHAGWRTGVLGTVNYRFSGQTRAAPNTTPDPVTFHGLLRQMVEAQVQAVVAEVSSHALEQRRVDKTHFDAGLFTNLSRDHLDYHGSLEAYFQAKARLFVELLGESEKADTISVLNLDDQFGRRLAPRCRARLVWGFSRIGRPEAILRVVRARLDLEGIEAELQTPAGPMTIRSPLLGEHSLENLLGAAGVGLGLGLSLDQVSEGLASCQRVPGRLDEVTHSGGFKVLVDYAHSPDAIRNVLSCLRPLTSGVVITVFGCGGDRDKGKRPLMGVEAARGSELALITSDNPRSEPPEAIIAEILPGVKTLAEAWREGGALIRGSRVFNVEPNRERAIVKAIGMARAGDVVVIFGKGHEIYQIIGKQQCAFDDLDVARRELADLGYR